MSNPRRMKIRRLDEFSLVDRPANPLATIVLTKRAPEEKPVTEQEMTEAQAVGWLTKALIGLGFKAPIAKRVQEKDGKWIAYDDAGEMLGSFDSKEEAEARAYGKKQEKVMPEETVTKAEVTELQKRLDEANARIEKAEADTKAERERVAKLETERRTAEFAKRAEGYKPLPVTDAFAAILMKCADVLTTEENAALDTVLSAGSEAMRKALTEIGSGAPEEGSAEAEVAKAVAEIRKQNPKLSEQAARGEVFKSNPALRQKLDAENR